MASEGGNPPSSPVFDVNMFELKAGCQWDQLGVWNHSYLKNISVTRHELLATIVWRIDRNRELVDAPLPVG